MRSLLVAFVAGLLAQGLSLKQGAIVGVEAHGRAGDLAARAGERGMLASDLLAQLRDVVNP